MTWKKSQEEEENEFLSPDTRKRLISQILKKNGFINELKSTPNPSKTLLKQNNIKEKRLANSKLYNKERKATDNRRESYKNRIKIDPAFQEIIFNQEKNLIKKNKSLINLNVVKNKIEAKSKDKDNFIVKSNTTLITKN